MEDKIRKLVPKKKEDAKEEEPTAVVITESEFFSLILGAKLVGHILHLQTKDFATHIALDEFYKGQQKNADKIIEVYQGSTERILNYDKDSLIKGWDDEPLTYLSTLKGLICGVRYDVIPKELSNVHNEIDNFISTLDQAVYKITFLK